MAQRHIEELVHVPRSAVRFPIELPVPAGFVASEPETWPIVEVGVLEFVEGKLLYMPPCGERHQVTVVDVTTTLGTWRRAHREFVVGGGEAGIILEGDVRGADAAVWMRSSLGAVTGRYVGVPPILAVEVKGELEEEQALHEKAQWYLQHGVEVAWLLFPADLRVVIVDADGQHRFAAGDRLPERASLPDLSPRVDELFAQLLERAT